MEDDPFDDLFNLEDKYYDDGYKQGFVDGLRQSSAESQVFGIEQGFKKFVAMGDLQARARIWSAKLRPMKSHVPNDKSHLPDDNGAVPHEALQTFSEPTENVAAHRDEPDALPNGGQPLPAQTASRLAKHLETLMALVDPTTLSLENTDDAVSDFDDRLKRAQAKAKVIEKLMGEHDPDHAIQQDGSSGATKAPRENSNIEDFGFT